MKIEDTRDPGVETDECVDCGDDCDILLERCTDCQRERDDLTNELDFASYERFHGRGR